MIIKRNALPRQLLLFLILTVIGITGVPRITSATVIFDWVCANQNTSSQCATDPALDLSIGFKDTVVTGGGSFTGADAGINFLNFTSGMGDGFSITLDHMVVDRNNLFIQFNAAADEVLRLEDAGADTLQWFGLGASNAPGLIRFTESHTNIAPPYNIFPYYISGRWDRQGATDNSSDPIHGKFVRRTEDVPEPASLALMGLGLVGLGFARKKKAA